MSADGLRESRATRNCNIERGLSKIEIVARTSRVM
jgi:hypothetical protein